jgi:hypothetical protein
MRYEIRPLGTWTDPVTTNRASSARFRATWQSTLDLLGRETELLGAGLVVMQIDVTEGDLRRDGMLRAQAKVGFPGVRVAFDSKYGPLTYATDAYDRLYGGDMPGWQANVRALALALEALRAVDRYGVTKRGEQYRGWLAIEAAGSKTTEQEARDLIASYGGVREAVKATHPDRGGDPAAFHEVQDARRVLGI